MLPVFNGLLETFLASGILAFILTFVRMGTAVMIMPGLGDSFVPERLRLMIALGLSFVLCPLTFKYMPAQVPGTFTLLMLIMMEFIIGLFFGTVARIFMTALDTAGMVISISSGLGNAQVFNPSLATQGSLVGAFLSITFTNCAGSPNESSNYGVFLGTALTADTIIGTGIQGGGANTVPTSNNYGFYATSASAQVIAQTELSLTAAGGGDPSGANFSKGILFELGALATIANGGAMTLIGTAGSGMGGFQNIGIDFD